MGDLSVQLFGKRYGNPVFLASGVLGETADSLVACHRAGAGLVVTKSIGVQACEGAPNPVYLSTPHYTLNCMGLPNPGIEEYAKELEVLRDTKTPFAGSVYADTPADFARLAHAMEDAGAHFVEINISCPNRKGFGDAVCADRKLTSEIVEAVASTLRIPVLPKLPPALPDPEAFALALAGKGAKGFVCTNTVRGIHIDAFARKAVLSRKFGGMAGPALKPVALYTVWQVYKETHMPIIGVGGVQTGTDAAEFLLAGACAVEAGSVVERDGATAFKRICGELSAYLDGEGLQSVQEVTGLAHK